MKKKLLFTSTLAFLTGFLFIQCSPTEKGEIEALPKKLSFSGYGSLEEYGGHLVKISGCHDCHTPRKMGPNGPELDMDLALSGHPTNLPLPDINRLELEQKGVVATGSPTAWMGPWGVSFASNITSDKTGIGNWDEENFFRAIREGKFKGLPDGRSLLPPMPWEMFKEMTDDEIKAIFAYLKSTKPVKNIVPAPEPPISAFME